MCYHGPVWVGRALQNHLVSYQNPSGSRNGARRDVVGVSEVVPAAVTAGDLAAPGTAGGLQHTVCTDTVLPAQLLLLQQQQTWPCRFRGRIKPCSVQILLKYLQGPVPCLVMR